MFADFGVQNDAYGKNAFSFPANSIIIDVIDLFSSSINKCLSTMYHKTVYLAILQSFIVRTSLLVEMQQLFYFSSVFMKRIISKSASFSRVQ